MAPRDRISDEERAIEALVDILREDFERRGEAPERAQEHLRTMMGRLKERQRQKRLDRARRNRM